VQRQSSCAVVQWSRIASHCTLDAPGLLKVKSLLQARRGLFAHDGLSVLMAPNSGHRNYFLDCLDCGTMSWLHGVRSWLGSCFPGSCLGDANYVKNHKEWHEESWDQAQWKNGHGSHCRALWAN